MRRLTINLLDEERQALYSLAKQERRDIRGQAALLIRQELQRLGLLLPTVDKNNISITKGS
ncbi:MAG: hypothetical protein H6653_20280 [Ardenticatenaceae bacterium]|nr:hypothetical protein [Ardenticatenaceae bacterium]